MDEEYVLFPPQVLDRISADWAFAWASGVVTTSWPTTREIRGTGRCRPAPDQAHRERRCHYQKLALVHVLLSSGEFPAGHSLGLCVGKTAEEGGSPT